MPADSLRDPFCDCYDHCLAHAAYQNKTINCSKCHDKCLAPKSKDHTDIPRQHRASYCDPGVVGIVDAAAILGVTVSRMHYMRSTGIGPEYEQLPKELGSLFRYRLDDLRRYQAAQLVIDALPPDEVQSEEAAKMIGITVGYLRKLRKKGQGPPSWLVGKAYRYKIVDVEAFARGRGV